MPRHIGAGPAAGQACHEKHTSPRHEEQHRAAGLGGGHELALHGEARKTGGNGLGMAIARSCFQACQGGIRCRNSKPGLEVVITLQNA